MAPFGSLLAGSLADAIGASRTVMVSGACCLLGAFWFIHATTKRCAKSLAPIYVNLGLAAPRVDAVLEDTAAN